MDNSEKITFSFTLLLVIVIIVSSLLIFILTPSPISPTRRIFGFITKLYTQNDTAFLDFDQAEWFQDTKTEFPASTACAQDNNCPIKCQLPVTKSCLYDGYYIRNPDHKNTTYSVAAFTKVGTLLFNSDWAESNPDSKPYKTISLSEFQNIFQNPNLPESWITNAPYDLTVIGGKIILINQHYIP